MSMYNRWGYSSPRAGSIHDAGSSSRSSIAKAESEFDILFIAAKVMASSFIIHVVVSFLDCDVKTIMNILSRLDICSV